MPEEAERAQEGLLAVARKLGGLAAQRAWKKYGARDGILSTEMLVMPAAIDENNHRK
ncbi:hypothetical protein GGR12_002918 [Brevundimonas lenta]|uniref:Uncharacterized protein n=1 Tax=Brevundimonas lenta TaxID=424796 RepID=A0A7W6NQ22_9CAUL|nr:hypothetical protein [Brevundimonas lenta]MBB4084030.1 hypothetical protein [Brevundimonas lenta]